MKCISYLLAVYIIYLTVQNLGIILVPELMKFRKVIKGLP